MIEGSWPELSKALQSRIDKLETALCSVKSAAGGMRERSENLSADRANWIYDTAVAALTAKSSAEQP